jgi:hypothetical protein
MQESVIVQGVLDELNQCVFKESDPEESRLLISEPIEVIDIERASQSFG